MSSNYKGSFLVSVSRPAIKSVQVVNAALIMVQYVSVWMMSHTVLSYIHADLQITVAITTYLQALGSLLQLAPCPFWRLEAAIAPGPRLPPDEPPSNDETAAADASALVDNNADSQPQASQAYLNS